MKKFKPWRHHRRLIRAAAKIDRADQNRADWFNAMISEGTKCPDYSWFINCPGPKSWPDTKDMFINVDEHTQGDPMMGPGLYRVENSDNYSGVYDALLTVINIKTKESGYLWFPRHGQSIVPCKELAL